MKLDTTSYKWHKGKEPNGVDGYAFEVQLKNGRCFEEFIHGDYEEALNRIADQYGNDIANILVGI